MNTDTIEARMAGRHMASVLHDLITEDFHDLIVEDGNPWKNGTGADYAESLLRELAKLLPHRKLDNEELQPLSRLGAVTIKFGLHKGEPYSNIPIGYLDWLMKSSEDSVKSLRAYLTHPDLPTED